MITLTLTVDQLHVIADALETVTGTPWTDYTDHLGTPSVYLATVNNTIETIADKVVAHYETGDAIAAAFTRDPS